MGTPAPPQEAVDRFEKSVDAATDLVLEEFNWIGLPDGDQLSDLHVEINDAITKVMREWL